MNKNNILCIGKVGVSCVFKMAFVGVWELIFLTQTQSQSSNPTETYFDFSFQAVQIQLTSPVLSGLGQNAQ